MAIRKLAPSDLYRSCHRESFGFRTTAELEDLDEVIGQPRAVAAVDFGLGIRHRGFNLFAIGPTGAGKYSLIQRYARQRAGREPHGPDWCYVFNFKNDHRPRALRLPPGRGRELAADVERLIEDLRAALRATFESDEYRTRSQGIEEELNERQQEALRRLNEQAQERQIALIRTPTGFTLAPVREGDVLTPEQFEALPDTERKRIERDVEELQGELRRTMHEAPKWQKESRDRLTTLNHEMAGAAVSHLLSLLRARYADLDEVAGWLDEVRQDVIANYQVFLQDPGRQPRLMGIELPGLGGGLPVENRYRVNTLVSSPADGGAPVVYEDSPSYNNLVGRIEHVPHLGALVTDFTMIRPGALHRANGGYLILDAVKLLSQPFAWEALKRSLQSGEVRMESLGQSMGLVSTVSLEPEPIPLDVKVVLMAEPHLYYLLSRLDPETREMFKVTVDFSDRMDWTEESERQYARLIATVVRRDRLQHLDCGAVGRVLEHSARELSDSGKLSTHMAGLTELLAEADHWSRQRQVTVVEEIDVDKAIDSRIHRMDRVRERLREEIARGTLFIDTDGEQVARINGLTVMDVAGFSFGSPARITARVRVGDGNVVDIEREVELGGPIHSKGVFILTALLGGRYLPDRPLALSASLVFEQSYGEIEGDSASAAELFCLLSALAQVPIRQGLAVTGSINQHGQIQPIGGVNEKIEGFFEVCSMRGLTGTQGVIIPAANMRHLMLRRPVREAVEAGRFSIHAIDTVDDGLELLTGLTAGERDADGHFPDGTFNRLVEDRLTAFSERMRAFSGKGGEDGAGGAPAPS